MKTKTNNLVGKALDWAVTVALNPEVKSTESSYILNYSTDPTAADVIIATFAITTQKRENDWSATIMGSNGFSVSTEYGPTREIAAMQAFAVYKIGEYIDVPPELLF